MPSYFCLTVRFLQPYHHGRTDGGEPEWPPSPLRLFQALVAAAGNRWRESQFREYAVPALHWLERLPSASIVAPVGQATTKYRLYVPDNVADKIAKSWSGGREASIADYRTEKDVRPTHLKGEGVHYLVPIPDEVCPHLEVLSAAARSMTHLGWGIDMVAGNASVLSQEDADKLAGERWRPVEDASATGYRVPIPGTLDDLIQKHQAFLTRVCPDGFRPVPPLSAFRVVGYRRVSDVPGHSYVAFKFLHPVLERSAWFAPNQANHVAAMTRHATANAAKQQPQVWVDTYVHGHRSTADDSKPRFSYVPLPSIEHRGQDSKVVGGIRRVLLAELTDVSDSQLLWAKQMLPGQFLVDERTGDKKAMLAPLESDWVLRQYVDQADTWASVTPVVLPGSDERKFAKAEKLFFKALRHSGYSSDALAELEFRNVSFWPGGDLALRYQRPEYLRKDCWTVYQVRLRWKEPIKGPLAIGAGRHCGLGVFARMID
jgi:CRISPR-associated protein Csb2